MTRAEDPAGAEGQRAKALLDAILQITVDADLELVIDRLVEALISLAGASGGTLSVREGMGLATTTFRHPTPEAAPPPSVGDVVPVVEVGIGAVLAVPVRVGRRQVGTLHLVRADGRPFAPHEDEVVRTFARAAGFLISIARDAARSARRQRWLEASARLMGLLHDEIALEDALDVLAHHVQETSGARAVAVVRLEGGSDAPQVVGGAGGAPQQLADLAVDLADSLRRASRDSTVVASARPDGAGVVLVPLRARVALGGVLVVRYAVPLAHLDTEEAGMLAALADQASLVLDRSQALADRQELMLISDRDRIARDLHDQVIQRLFATGLQLEGARRVSDSAVVQDRLSAAIADLDVTISEIRTTIFQLQEQRTTSLRARVAAVVEEYADLLGFAPALRLSGPVDAAVPPAVGDHLLAVLRESLSNITRHAGAGWARVRVTARVDRLVLVVEDDGPGLPATRDESGLRNVRRRARDLGGAVEVGDRRDGGTRVRWEVPLAEAP